MLKICSILLSILSVIVLSSCDSKSNKIEGTKQTPITIRMAFENQTSEAFAQGCLKWKELLEEKSDGRITLELYPNSSLGNKTEILERIANGENIATLADGAFYFDMGMKDLGITFAPFLFYNWDQALKLHNSQWFINQAKLLEKKTNLKIISANWKYGLRHTLTTKPIHSINDFKNLKIRVPNNIIQAKTFEALGAKPVKMPLSDVYTALQKGIIDGVENPLNVLYKNKFYEVAKYLLLDGHVYNLSNIVINSSFYNSLTKKDQQIIKQTCDEASEYQNIIMEQETDKFLAKFKEQGVIVSLPDPGFKRDLILRAKGIYDFPEFKHWKINTLDMATEAMYSK